MLFLSNNDDINLGQSFSVLGVYQRNPVLVKYLSSIGLTARLAKTSNNLYCDCPFCGVESGVYIINNGKYNIPRIKRYCCGSAYESFSTFIIEYIKAVHNEEYTVKDIYLAIAKTYEDLLNPPF